MGFVVLFYMRDFYILYMYAYVRIFRQKFPWAKKKEIGHFELFFFPFPLLFFFLLKWYVVLCTCTRREYTLCKHTNKINLKHMFVCVYTLSTIGRYGLVYTFIWDGLLFANKLLRNRCLNYVKDLNQNSVN